MDTSSHVCMGVATGLIVSNLSARLGYDADTTTIVITSVVANVFPDIDVLFKLKSNEKYINNHRGMTHSFFLALVWIILISFIPYLVYHHRFLPYFITAVLGISLHIFTDLLNGYGVQFLWPTSKKWIAFGLTYTFDALVFIIHILAFIGIFIFDTPVLRTLGFAYLIIGIYILIAYLYHYYLKKQLIKKYGKFKRLILQSKSTPFSWKYVYETKDKKFFIGVVHRRKIIQLRYEKRQEILSPELEAILLKNKDVKAFIDFTPIFNYHIKHIDENTIEIKYYDLRYLMVRKNTQYYSFNCLARVKYGKVINSYLGFTVSEGSEDKIFARKVEKND